MSKRIEAGCFAEIQGSMTAADGTVVQVMSEGQSDAQGYAIWVINEEFPNPAGVMTNHCYEYFLHRLDGDVGELCTDWADVYRTCGEFIPDHLEETA